MDESHRHNIKGERLNTKNTYSTQVKFQIDNINPPLWKSEWFLFLGLTDWTREWRILLVAFVVVAQYIHSQMYQFVYWNLWNLVNIIFTLVIFSKLTNSQTQR